MSLRILFMGTAELACGSLEALLRPNAFAHEQCEVVAVVTQPDRPHGRNLRLQPSPVKKVAIAAGCAVLQPEKARDPGFVEKLRGLNLDLIVVAAYGQILPQSILDLPRFGCINVHTSLLPKYRGAAPIQWAILNGDNETGVTLMKMAAGLDTGDILAQSVTPIRFEDDAATLHDRLAQMGAELLIATIPPFVRGEITPRPQDDSKSSYARKITKEDGRIDWSLPARVIWNRVRGLTPWPGTFSYLQGAKPVLLKILRAEMAEAGIGQRGDILRLDKSGFVVACGEGALRVLEVQREGGRKMAVGEFLAGHPLKPGDKLGSPNT